MDTAAENLMEVREVGAAVAKPVWEILHSAEHAVGGEEGGVAGGGSDSISNTNHTLVLQEGWEERQDANERTYYVNHITRKTQWQHPGYTEVRMGHMI